MILMDANVLVYAHDSADTVKCPTARRVLDALPAGARALSAQCLAEFFSVVTRPYGGAAPRLTAAEAVAQVALLAESFVVFDLSQPAVLEACRGVRDHSMSHNDAQIWAVAKLNQVPVVFSEDFQDGMVLEGVRFVNPFVPGFDVTRWV